LFSFAWVFFGGACLGSKQVPGKSLGRILKKSLESSTCQGKAHLAWVSIALIVHWRMGLEMGKNPTTQSVEHSNAWRSWVSWKSVAVKAIVIGRELLCIYHGLSNANSVM
jgi:hypothetical protein